MHDTENVEFKFSQLRRYLNLNFEPSFVGIYQVLKDIWLFEHEFQDRHFGQP